MLCQPTPTNFSRDQEDGDGGRRRFCRSMTDNITCWPRTESGTFAVVSCPTQYDDIPFLPGNATKFCGVNGTWDRGSNYSECLPSEFTGESFSIHNYIIRIIYFVGFSASVFALFIALVIFIYYRCLWCLRNKIHCHLIATFILKNLLWLKMVSTITLLAADEHNHVHQVVCKTMVTIFNYLVVTNFFWMLVEGLYLHTMIVWAFLLDQLRFWHYAFLGWCLPALIIICWVVVKLKLDDNSCWLPDSNSSFDYIFIGPIFWVLLVNLIFLASIVWILVTKLRTSNYPQNCLYRKATRATLILFPLLGLTYLLFLWSPNDGQIIVFGYINSILQSTQGLFVATIYCFLNAEVQSAVKNHLIRWRDDRRLTILRTRTSLASNAAEHVSLQTKGSSAVQGAQATGGNEFTPKNVDAGPDSRMNLPRQQDLIQIT